MVWSESNVFRQWLADSLNRAVAYDLDGDSFKLALYNSSITPDQNVTNANLAYNTGQWANTNEVAQAAQWPAGGPMLAGVSVHVGTNGVVFFDANDTASGSAATLANVYGGLVYDDTVTTPTADPGVCYNYFGGTNSVTNGTLTVVWHANGIWRATL